MISRRKALTIIGFSTICVTSGKAFALRQYQEMVMDDCRFEWWVDQSRLRCTFVAPAAGWLAVGFGPSLNTIGTRFVMVDPQDDHLRSAEMLASPSGPAPFSSHPQGESFQALTGGRDGNTAWMSCAVKLPFFSNQTMLLQSQQKANLMLAWSMSTDFDHHSAWRRHIKIDL